MARQHSSTPAEARRPMRYYLAQYVGTGTELDPFRPAGTDGAAWSSIDLRPDSRLAAGYALVAGPPGLTAVGLLDVLTDDPADTAAATRLLLQTKLGVTLDSGLAFRRLLRQLLTEKAGAGRWKALRPERDAWRIYLGGLIDEVPVIAGGAILTESFNKANSTTLGPDQTWTEVAGDMTVASNKIRPAAATGVQGYARAESDLATSDNYAQIQVITLTAPTASKFAVIAACCRFASAATTFYRAHLNDSNGTKVCGLRKVVAGTATTLGSDQTVTPTLPSTVYVEASGSTVKTKLDGVQKHSLTDTGIATGVRAGVGIYLDTGVVANCEGDNWRAGDLVQTQSLSGGTTPTGVAVKAPAKVLVGSTSPAGSVVKSDAKTLAGSVAPTGSALRLPAKSLAGSVAPAGGLVRTAGKALAASLVPGGTAVKDTSKGAAGGVAPAGSVVVLPGKTLGGTVGASGSLTRAAAKALAASLTPGGVVVKDAAKGAAGDLAPSGDVSRLTPRTLVGTVAPSGAVERATAKLTGGSVAPGGALVKSTARTLAGSVAAAGGMAKTVGKAVAGSVAPAGAVSTVVTVLRDLIARAGPLLSRFTSGDRHDRTDAGARHDDIVGPGWQRRRPGSRHDRYDPGEPRG